MSLRFSLPRANRRLSILRRGGQKKLTKTESASGDTKNNNNNNNNGTKEGTQKVPISGLAEVDNSSMDELSRFEPPERPPSLAQIQKMTAHRFSEQWLKYIYNRFKNECPTGRMKFVEFRRLFGMFIPDRVSDAYLERMFYAFCQQSCATTAAVPSSQHGFVVDYLTFQDLVVALYRLCDENARANAEWTMRLIVAGGAAAVATVAQQSQPQQQQQQQQLQQPQQQQINYGEFFEFVRSVFALRGKADQGERKRNAGSLLMGGGGGGTGPSACQQRRGSAASRKATIVRSAAMFASAITAPTAGPAIAHLGRARSSSAADGDAMIRAASEQRAIVLFKELDADEKGFLTANDFEQFFARQQKPLVYVS